MATQPFFVPAVVIGLLALPLILGIPPNPLYGVRTRRTLADRRLWYRANRFGGWCLLAATVVYLVIAALTPDGGGADLGAWGLHLVAFVGPLALSVLLIGRYLRRG